MPPQARLQPPSLSSLADWGSFDAEITGNNVEHSNSHQHLNLLHLEPDPGQNYTMIKANGPFFGYLIGLTLARPAPVPWHAFNGGVLELASEMPTQLI